MPIRYPYMRPVARILAASLAVLALAACQDHRKHVVDKNVNGWEFSDGRRGYQDDSGQWFWYAMMLNNNGYRSTVIYNSTYSTTPGVTTSGYVKGPAPTDAEKAEAKPEPLEVVEDAETGEPKTPEEEAAEPAEAEATPAGENTQAAAEPTEGHEATPTETTTETSTTEGGGGDTGGGGDGGGGGSTD